MPQTGPIIKRKRPLELFEIYRIVSLVLVPVLVLFLVFEKQFGLTFSFYQKAVLIYCVFTLTLLQIICLNSLFRKHFHYAHYLFQAGVIVLVYIWFFDNPGLVEASSLLLASLILSVTLINPLASLVFGIGSVLSFLLIGAVFNVFYLELTLILFSGHLIVTVVNYWRFSIFNDLKTARKSFKSIFDTASQKTFVLDENFHILELNEGAEKYLYKNQIESFENTPFESLMGFETEACANNFFNSIEECDSVGQSKFIANCTLLTDGAAIPKEFNLKKTKFFNQDVYVVTVRVIAEQKKFENELLTHKENVSQILNNIESFVFNISFDKTERFKHKVNYVSQKVWDVYGYSVDEYIALVKSERISKDRHPDDIDKINQRFESLVAKGGGDDQWRFRMKVRGEYRWIEEKINIQLVEDSSFISVFGIVKDVTEEVLAQRALQESEQKYKQLFESNLAGVYKTHFDGRILDCNLAFAQMLGYDTADELIGTQVEDLYINKEERKAYIELLRHKKGLNNYISTLKRKDGRRLILNNNVSIIKENSDTFNVSVGTVVDVTSLHETSLALKYSEEKYRMLFEDSGNAILLMMMNGEESMIVDINTRGTDLFEYPENDIIGKTIASLSSEKEKFSQDLTSVFKELEEKGRAEREWVFKRKDGIDFHAEVAFVFVNLDNEKLLQLAIKDISERKQYEKEILESRLSFKNIVDQAPASIFIFTNEMLTYLNPRGEKLYLEVMKSKGKKMYNIFPEHTHYLIKDMIVEANNNIPSYTEIALADEKRYSINVVKTVYNQKPAHIFILNDISLQSEYNIQKLRAELAEETNASLQEEIVKHKQTQQSLLDSTARLRALFESTSNLYILSIDKNATIGSYNSKLKKGLKELLHYDVKEGDNFVDIFPQEDYAKKVLLNRFNRALNGETLEMVAHFPSKAGREVWMQCFMNPIEVEGEAVREISFIAHDITEQIENKRKIVESEENNRAIVLAVPDVLFRVNKKGIITDFRLSGESNVTAFEKLTKSNNLIGEKITDVIINKKIGEEIVENVNKALLENELISHNMTLYLDESDKNTKIHYENRYSKMNDDEVVIISRNITDTIEYEEKLIESVKEKEILLKEVHHRVKNNLQVINSILNLQSSYVKDDETLQIIIESQNRIRSMSYIHESLYQTKDFSSINFNDYISNLVQNLVHSYDIHSDKTKLTLKIDKVELALDQAIPCGLILNELITNSLKYAYPEDKKGEIKITVQESKGKVSISVQDFGVGLPENFSIQDSDSLGLSLVDTLIDQLDGELILKTESGTEFLIIFEKQEI